MRKELRAYVRQVNSEEHSLEAYVSTAALASDGMIILPNAWEKDMAQFMRNPVIPWHHDYPLGPVAQATSWRTDETGLILTIAFDMRKPLGIETWNSYEDKFLRAFSVGWDTKEMTREMSADEVLEKFGDQLPAFVKAQIKDFGKVKDEKKKDGDDLVFSWRRDGIPVITRAALLEASCVTVPADSYALARAEKATRLAERLGEPDMTRPGWEDTNTDDAKDGQIRYRIKDPKLFEDDSIKTQPLDVKGEGDVQLILGKLKKPPEGQEGSMVNQAVHFNKKDGWTMKAAQEWWKEQEKKKKGYTTINVTLDEAFQHFIDGSSDERLHGIQLAIDEHFNEERVGKVLSAKNKTAITKALASAKVFIADLQGVLDTAEEKEEKEANVDTTNREPESFDDEFTALAAAVERESLSRQLDEALAET